MGVETFGFIDDLEPLWPIGSADPKSQGDDHLRGIKATLQAQFGLMTANDRGWVLESGELRCYRGGVIVARIDANGLSAENRRVLNVATPTAASDAARKDYVDTAETDAVATAAAYTDSRDAATLASANAYADSVAPQWSKDAGNARVINVGAPSVATDAATRGYVDTAIGGITGTVTKFESAPIGYGLTGAVNHGLGGRPDGFLVVMRCQTTDAGYAVGDEVDLGNLRLANDYPKGMWANTTQVGWSLAATAANIAGKSGTYSTFTNTRWQFICRAWRVS